MDSARTTNPLPADAATIPVTARDTFHLPPAANTPSSGRHQPRSCRQRHIAICRRKSSRAPCCRPLAVPSGVPGRPLVVVRPAPRQPCRGYPRQTKQATPQGPVPAKPVSGEAGRSYLSGAFSYINEHRRNWTLEIVDDPTPSTVWSRRTPSLTV